MKDLTITSVIKVYEYDELNDTDRALLDDAIEATRRSYAPYSHFSVGAAALLANGVVVTGTNQENAAYPSGLCAERTTLFYANSQYPDQAVVTLAIAARTEKDFIDTPIPPCGACRQVILETEKRYKLFSFKNHLNRWFICRVLFFSAVLYYFVSNLNSSLYILTLNLLKSELTNLL